MRAPATLEELDVAAWTVADAARAVYRAELEADHASELAWKAWRDAFYDTTQYEVWTERDGDAAFAMKKLDAARGALRAAVQEWDTIRPPRKHMPVRPRP